MTISLYDVSVAALIRGLGNLSAILEKAAAHATAKSIEPAVLAQARLFPDMLPLTSQVQIACDTAKGCGGRLAGIEIPKHEDNEKNLADLAYRVSKTLDYLKSIKPEQLAGAESRTVELKFPNRTLTFTGQSYLSGFVLPNFYFHLSIAYALLRHNGVEIGKSDYLGQS